MELSLMTGVIDSETIGPLAHAWHISRSWPRHNGLMLLLYEPMLLFRAKDLPMDRRLPQRPFVARRNWLPLLLSLSTV
jgi:hypothetical protein